jgi:glycosyltransferase involved in cell wall biosynthesis
MFEIQAGRKNKSAEDQPVISVIIPAFNEERMIGRCLAALAAQDVSLDIFEVIVVDNGSSDHTLEVARTFADSLKLTLLSNPGLKISALRNLGATSSKAKFLAFLDADCIAPRSWLRNALGRLESGDGGVIGSFYTIPAGSSWLARAWYGDFPRSKQGRVSYVPSGTLIVSRSVFLAVGGFDATIETSEDVELCRRISDAGYSVVGDASLSTVHLGTPQTLRAFYQKQRWHGNGIRQALFREKLRRCFAKTLLQTSLFLFAILVFVGLIPVAVIAHNFILLALPVIFLGCCSAFLAMRAVSQRGKWKLFAPLMFLYLVYGLARSLSLIVAANRSDRAAAGIGCSCEPVKQAETEYALRS